MKSISFLILILLPIVTLGQKVHFTDSTNTWKIWHINNGPPTVGDYAWFGYNGDTTINSVVYKKMSCPYWYASYNINTFPAESYAFIREDSTINKVFILENDTEQILMDYNLIVGDSIIHKNYHDDIYVDTVTSIDSIIINSVYHKIWHFYPIHIAQNGGFGSYPPYVVIEGIGSLFGPLFMPTPYWGLDEYNLSCFSNNGTNPIISPSVAEGFNGVYFDNTTSCTLGIDNLVITGQQYSISPNPATTLLTISGRQNISYIIITNMLGQIVYKAHPNSLHAKIDVSSLNIGIYFAEINGVYNTKFLKE